MVHRLKTLPIYYSLLKCGFKHFELRKFDRPFVAGDTLILDEWDPTFGFSGSSIKFLITYVLHNVPDFGLRNGFCILSLIKIPLLKNQKIKKRATEQHAQK